jgi:predicted nucleic-acid-binding Zn-ribbon protein
MDPEIHPMALTNCPKCPGVRVLCHTNISVHSFSQHKTRGSRFGATASSGPVSATQALVCTECGYLELYAEEPNRLVE